MPKFSMSQRRRWMVRSASVFLLVPVVAWSATAPSSPAEPSPAIQGDRHEFQRVVVSTSDGRFDDGVDNQGWWSNTSRSTDGNDNYLVGECGDCPEYGRYRNFFTFELPPLQRNVVAARLVVRRGLSEGGVTETLDLYHVRTPARRLNNNRGVDLPIYRDLGSGTRYGRFQVATERDADSAVGMWLNAEAIEDMNAARGSYFSIGGTLASASRANEHEEGLFGRTTERGVQELRLFVRKPPG